MHRIPVAAISIGILLGPALAIPRAESHTSPRVEGAATTSGRVHGYVKDAAGLAVVDASVLAVGQTVVAARTDVNGRFQMSVPPGDYILRATRIGYVSTYREPVRVHSSISLERTITLIRQADGAVPNVSDSHAHTELAWQLRHLPRSVLRDGTAEPEGRAGADTPLPGRSGTLFGRAMDSSMRLASRIADTDFTGQLNFVTTTLANPSASMAAFPRSVAYVTFGAPVGGVGDWRVRGAVGSGAESSWNVLGEYEAHSTQAHAVRFGMSFSSHASRELVIGQWSRPTQEARSVTGVFGRDHWRPMEDLEVEYAVRADRYDYLAAPYLLSGSGGIRARVLPAMYLAVRASRAMLAPGAEEFLPPSEGPWLPPERTFRTLNPGDAMQAETVRHVEMDLGRELGPLGRASSIHLRAFAQETSNQIATLFETGGDMFGTYRVARVGTVGITGWAVGFSGQAAGAVTGHLEYSRLAADWNRYGRTRGLRRLAPFVIRDDLEWLNDLTATLDASFSDSRTRVRLVYRTNSAFSDDDHARPAPGSRFDIQLHQALPYRPLPNSRLELMFAVRTLFRDPQSGSSRYDELLTVAPPLRLMCGVQMRF